MSQETNQDPVALYQHGLELIQKGEIDHALAIGHELEKQCFTGCFEIEYQARLHQGNEEQALAALERGTQLVPEAWYLWKLIGIHHSDREQWEGARDALGKALTCSGADPSDIHCNLAVVEFRAHRIAEARAHLAEVSEPRAQIFAKTVEIDLLAAEERFQDAVQEGRAWLESCADADRGLLAEVHTKLADALWRGEQDAGLAGAELSKALALDNSNPRTARVLREIRGERSPAASMWRIQLQGVVRGLEEGEKFGFYTTYFVVAENEEQALHFVERFEPTEYHTDLKIAEAEAIEPAADSLLGVYEQRGGYSAFPLD